MAVGVIVNVSACGVGQVVLDGSLHIDALTVAGVIKGYVMCVHRPGGPAVGF